MPGGVVRRRGEELVALVARGREQGGSEPASSIPPRPEPQQLALVTRLMNITRTTAEELKVSPELLATRRDVEQLVFSRRAERLSSGWRKDVIGDRLIAKLDCDLIFALVAALAALGRDGAYFSRASRGYWKTT